jgi:hypothetical protein
MVAFADRNVLAESPAEVLQVPAAPAPAPVRAAALAAKDPKPKAIDTIFHKTTVRSDDGAQLLLLTWLCGLLGAAGRLLPPRRGLGRGGAARHARGLAAPARGCCGSWSSSSRRPCSDSRAVGRAGSVAPAPLALAVAPAAARQRRGRIKAGFMYLFALLVAAAAQQIQQREHAPAKRNQYA